MKTQVQCEMAITAPVHKVWDIVQDSMLLPRWMPNVDHTEITTEQSKSVGEVRQDAKAQRKNKIKKLSVFAREVFARNAHLQQ